MTLTHERLLERLHYNPITGIFMWREPLNNRIKAGNKLAGTIKPSGHWRITIDGKFYYAHRLAWFYMTGRWPDGEIDHINSNPTDNSFVNLREATRSQNSANTRRRSDNTSGLKGASWSKSRRKWISHIKNQHIGSFTNKEDAHAAYSAAAEEMFGEFARSS